MPRKNPFPAKEAVICQRVREVRLSTGLSQVAFSRRIGIDSTKLAAYEHCRAPLKYSVADKIAREFDICQRWLAIGVAPRNYYVEIDPAVSANYKNDLFSFSYDAGLNSLLDGYLSRLATTQGCKEEELEKRDAEFWKRKFAEAMGVSPDLSDDKLEAAYNAFKKRFNLVGPVRAAAENLKKRKKLTHRK